MSQDWRGVCMQKHAPPSVNDVNTRRYSKPRQHLHTQHRSRATTSEPCRLAAKEKGNKANKGPSVDGDAVLEGKNRQTCAWSLECTAVPLRIRNSRWNILQQLLWAADRLRF